jgi:hypothetical protein
MADGLSDPLVKQAGKTVVDLLTRPGKERNELCDVNKVQGNGPLPSRRPRKRSSTFLALPETQVSQGTGLWGRQGGRTKEEERGCWEVHPSVI